MIKRSLMAACFLALAFAAPVASPAQAMPVSAVAAETVDGANEVTAVQWRGEDVRGPYRGRGPGWDRRDDRSGYGYNRGRHRGWQGYDRGRHLGWRNNRGYDRGYYRGYYRG